jgi:hypothetical protein
MDDLFTLHNHGVFLRREAISLGYDDPSLRYALRTGVIRRVRHGAYVEAALWNNADPREQHRLRSHAVLAAHAPGSVALSHTSAVVMHGIDVWEPELSKIHLTRIDGHTARNPSDVRYHYGSVRPGDMVTTSGARTTSAARAVLEYASLVDIPHGVVALDALLNVDDGVESEMRGVYDTIAGWPNMATLQISTRLARVGAESVGESIARVMMWSQHLPEPVLQFKVYDALTGVLLGTTDFAWPKYRLLGEFDGRVKYGRLLKPGQSAGDAVFAEKRREDRIREATGWSMIRFTWGDVLHRPEHTAERLRRALGLNAA